jgi:hypothetical protein
MAHHPKIESSHIQKFELVFTFGNIDLHYYSNLKFMVHHQWYGDHTCGTHRRGNSTTYHMSR